MRAVFDNNKVMLFCNCKHFFNWPWDTKCMLQNNSLGIGRNFLTYIFRINGVGTRRYVSVDRCSPSPDNRFRYCDACKCLENNFISFFNIVRSKKIEYRLASGRGKRDKVIRKSPRNVLCCPLQNSMVFPGRLDKEKIPCKAYVVGRNVWRQRDCNRPAHSRLSFPRRRESTSLLGSPIRSGMTAWRIMFGSLPSNTTTVSVAISFAICCAVTLGSFIHTTIAAGDTPNPF